MITISTCPNFFMAKLTGRSFTAPTLPKLARVLLTAGVPDQEWQAGAKSGASLAVLALVDCPER